MKKFLLAIFLLFNLNAYCQQDVDFVIGKNFFEGIKILKVSRDFYDPYLWVLAANNAVYRISSISNEVDDYSSNFSPYSSFKFTHIAGKSKDAVYLATSSNTVLQFANGQITSISTSQGLNEPVISIGISYDSSYYISTPDFAVSPLMISTEKGIYFYNMDSSLIYRFAEIPDCHIYEATYRSSMRDDHVAHILGDNITRDVTLHSGNGLYVNPIYEGESGSGSYGKDINTATYTSGLRFPDMFSCKLFWGTNQGLYTITNKNNYRGAPFTHSLVGIPVNKVTTIYGLTDFGNHSSYIREGFIKQNVLIGTSQGLYFSSSTYDVYDEIKTEFSLFHYDGLGNVNINDICVNHTSTNRESICENGVWIAADNGLTLLKPDYAKYVNVTKLTAAMFKGQILGENENQLCDNKSTKAVIYNSFVNNNLIQWYKNGLAIANANKKELTISDPGDYHAVLFSPCENIHIETNILKVTLMTAPEFTFDYPKKIELCENGSKILKVDGKPSYQYRWYLNGILLDENSNEITADQQGRYKAEVSSCPGYWDSTNEVEIEFLNLPIPSLTANKANYCMGDEADLTIDVPVDASYTINWFRDGVVLDAFKNKANVKTAVAGSYSANVENSIKCGKSSKTIPIVFNSLPIVVITPINQTTLCDGQSIDLKVNYSGGSVIWSTGETTDNININQTGIYKVIATSAAGCSNEASIPITFMKNPVLFVSDTIFCPFNQQSVQLSAPPGFRKYIWDGVEGMQNLLVSRLGKVSLTVEDNNGCRASHDIMISSFCSEIKMPNTFTPNGDGINDTWTIYGIGEDSSFLVQVYNRNGGLVFESEGNAKIWDGRYNGKTLSQGTYYYVITAKNGNQKLSGSVSIVY